MVDMSQQLWFYGQPKFLKLPLLPLSHTSSLSLSCFVTAALVGNLGRLTIKNSFRSVQDGRGGEVTTKTGIPAVVDAMEVVIESVKLSR